MIQIVRLESIHLYEAQVLFAKHFLPIIYGSFNITKENVPIQLASIFDALDTNYIENQIDNKISFAALDDEKLVGLALNKIVNRDVYKSSITKKISSQLLEKHNHLNDLRNLHVKADILNQYNAAEIFDFQRVVIDPTYRQKYVGYQLMKFSISEAYASKCEIGIAVQAAKYKGLPEIGFKHLTSVALSYHASVARKCDSLEMFVHELNPSNQSKL